MEHVNHPKHYNSHPNGIECIEIIRHYVCDIANALKYLWRAGLKPEMGMKDAEKEIEDLKKAIFYIEDFLSFDKEGCIGDGAPIRECEQHEELYLGDIVLQTTGYSIEQITDGYPKEIKSAMYGLLQVGIIVNGTVIGSGMMCGLSYGAIENIQQRILDIEHQLLNKELKSTVQVMNGQAVDGEDYVSKPGCVRKTEPEHYDPMNMIVAWGRVYSLTDEVRKKPNGALYSPCDNCDLSEYCASLDEKSQMANICELHAANNQQYYREVGVAKYSPRFGTVEVVDKHKEMELELKRLEEE